MKNIPSQDIGAPVSRTIEIGTTLRIVFERDEVGAFHADIAFRPPGGEGFRLPVHGARSLGELAGFVKEQVESWALAAQPEAGAWNELCVAWNSTLRWAQG